MLLSSLQWVSEQLDLTAAQLLDVLEGKFADLKASSMTYMVGKAVEKAMYTMCQSLKQVLMTGHNMATKKFGTELEAMTGRLEGRINRSRKYHESLINTMRNEQLKFQTKVKSTLTARQFGPIAPNKPQGSVNHPGEIDVCVVWARDTGKKKFVIYISKEESSEPLELSTYQFIII